MLILLRIVFGAALLYEMVQGARRAPATMGEAGDVTGAFYMAVWVVLAILNALVWAPYFGAKLSHPIAGMMTDSTYRDENNWVLRLIRSLDARRYRRATLLFSFWEGVRHPSLPAAFVVGLRNARPGSWLEKVYAREVFRFNNTQNCLQAYLALKRHGIQPRPHANQEVNILLLSLERPARPEAQVIAVPGAPPPATLKRNPRIQLFKREQAESVGAGALDRGQAEAAASPHAASVPVPSVDAEPSETTEPAGGRWWSNLRTRVVAFLRAE
jgi:hypothetical protein